jgi:signal transduction histidine kinase
MNETVHHRLLAPVDAEISARIAWLIQLRWLAIAGTLVAIAAANALLHQALPALPLVGVVAFISLYNLGFHIYSRRLRREQAPASQSRHAVNFMYVQICLDLICLTALLHFAGGAENPFWALYVLHVIIASILLSRAAAFIYAGLGALLFGGLIGLEYSGALAHVALGGVVHPAQYREPIYLLAVFVAFVATVFFSAVMATTLMARLRQRDRDLLEANARNEERARELSELNRRLQEADEARRMFIRLATHELRAPIAAIQSYINLVLGGYVPAEKQAETLDRANKRASEELDRINDLLVLSQVQDKPAVASAVDLGEVANQAIELLRGSMVEKGISLKVNLEVGAPPVMASRDQIAHVWTNLISNAVKYTPAGGSVTVAVTHTPTFIRGSVKDTGMGISAADQPRIFDEFFRTAQAKKMQQHGTGLGLAIVKRIVDRLGGRVWVRSAVGQGAEFAFAFPKGGAAPEKFQQEVDADIAPPPAG